MNSIKMYCLSIDDKSYENIKEMNYIPVGLGQYNYKNNWLRDNTGENISIKNKYYGEYTFHYWLWKNEIQNIDSKNWIGFCAYRRFWSNERLITNNDKKFEDRILKTVPEIWNNYDVILGNKILMNEIKWIKILKYGKISLIRNPKAVLKKNRNIKFQFDMFHGNGILDKAIDILDPKDKNDFREFVNTNHSYNQGNMFISKSKKLISEYYENIFNWLFECEKIFGFNLQGYSNTRIYAFLAERFLPFWFNKYANCLEWPIISQDLRKENFK